MSSTIKLYRYTYDLLQDPRYSPTLLDDHKRHVGTGQS